jgi:ABC-type transport system substrate-binding protein
VKTTDPQEKTKLYKAAQDIIWKESPWVPLVVEKLVSAHSNRPLAPEGIISTFTVLNLPVRS